MRALITAALVALAACHVAPPPDVPPGPPIPEGDEESTPLGKMCVRLRELRCSEGEPRTKNGKTRTCYQAMTATEDNAPIPVECVIAAPTQEAARACGDPARQITFRCVPSG
jgi:hypothetical protein